MDKYTVRTPFVMALLAVMSFALGIATAEGWHRQDRALLQNCANIFGKGV